MAMTNRQQIFVFTASNARAQHNLDRSIRSRIDLSLAERYFNERDQEVIRRFDREHGLYTWGTLPGGASERVWSAMRPDDWVLCEYYNDYHYVAQVVGTFTNIGCANELWGMTEYGKTWSLMYFVTKPVAVYVPVSACSPCLSRKYMGFTRISDDRLSAIESSFGSTKSFIDQMLLRAPTSSKKITRDDVIEAIRDFDGGLVQTFRLPQRHFLEFEERFYPPKVIFALASRRTAGRILEVKEISSGANSHCLMTLRSLGFEITSRPSAQDRATIL
jgi:hypothetical protein